MLKFFRDLLGEKPETENSNNNYTSDSTYGGDDSERKLQLATCALFLEVAQADEKFQPDEREKIFSVMKDMFDLSSDEIDELMKQSDEYIKQSVSLYEFTDVINNHFDKNERYEIIKNVWRLILTDEKIHKYEEHFVRTITANFKLEHRDMITAKMEVKEELEL